jgi:glycerol-3-phosphate acyltransferase PlsX
VRIALDAMGGDRGSELLVQGAMAALQTRDDIEVILLGPAEVMEKQVEQLRGQYGWERLSVVHAPEIISMHESPVEAVRKKKQSTVMVGFELVRQGNADAVVSAGNSGATMAAAIRKLGRLQGVSRPGLASLFPSLKKPVMIMDLGANVDCRPRHLFEFAIMAASCFSVLLGDERPRIGLLSNGEEAGKGNGLVKETHGLLVDSDLNFIGNVEGRDVYRGDVDVIVCDGFIGNVSLKISEGLAEAAMKMLEQEIRRTWRAKVGYLLLKRAFINFRRRVDYAEYGGAPLLGINGVGVVSHGKSNARAIASAIDVAATMVEKKINDSILNSLTPYSS